MWFPFVTRMQPYTRLATNVHSGTQNSETTGKIERRTKWIAFLLLSACLVSGTLGFLAAELVNKGAPIDLEFRRELKKFSYNRDFSYPPSNTTDTAWNGLFPGNVDGGFFNHPYVKGERATLSVLHQLHCLNGIRHIYYLNNDAATTGHILVDEDLEPHMRRNHMRHCLDFLRQSLMCCGDSGIEKVDQELKGVTGWGTEHLCMDWGELKEWVKERQRLDWEE